MRMSTGGAYLGPGVGGTASATLPGRASRAAPEAAGAPQGNGTMPHITVLGVGGILAAIWVVQKVQPSITEHVPLVNLGFVVASSSSAILTILLLKLLFNKFPVTNVTNTVNAI